MKTLACGSGHSLVDVSDALVWTFCIVWKCFNVTTSLNFFFLTLEGLKDTPTQEDWLVSVLPEGSKVGVDPFIIPAGWFYFMFITLGWATRFCFLASLAVLLCDMLCDDETSNHVSDVVVIKL